MRKAPPGRRSSSPWVLYTEDFSVLTAPLASVLTLQFSPRVVTIAGGLIAALGMLLASLDLSLPWLYLSMGFLEGDHVESFLSLDQLKTKNYMHWLSV